MLWDFFQDYRLQRAESGVDSAHGAALTSALHSADLRARVEVLEGENQRLLLAVMALAEILRDDFDVAPSRIELKMLEIDERDGELDGQVASPLAPCLSCQRLNRSTRPTCLYCGARIERAPLVTEAEDTGPVEIDARW